MSYIIFDYLCTNCDHFEADMFVRRRDQDDQDCPKCGALMTRQPAGPTTTFKFGDRSATKSRKAVSLRDPHGGASSRGHSSSLD